MADGQNAVGVGNFIVCRYVRLAAGNLRRAGGNCPGRCGVGGIAPSQRDGGQRMAVYCAGQGGVGSPRLNVAVQVHSLRVRRYGRGFLPDGNSHASRGGVRMVAVARDLIPHIVRSGVRSHGNCHVIAACGSGGSVRAEDVLQRAACRRASRHKFLRRAVISQRIRRGRGYGRISFANGYGNARRRNVAVIAVARNFVPHIVRSDVCSCGNRRAVTFCGSVGSVRAKDILHRAACDAARVHQFLFVACVGKSGLCRWRDDCGSAFRNGQNAVGIGDVIIRRHVGVSALDCRRAGSDCPAGRDVRRIAGSQGYGGYAVTVRQRTGRNLHFIRAFANGSRQSYGLVRRCNRNGTLRNFACSGGGVAGQRIVPRAGSAQGQAANVHRLAVTRFGVCKHGGSGDAQAVAGQQAVIGRVGGDKFRRSASVIGLFRRREAGNCHALFVNFDVRGTCGVIVAGLLHFVIDRICPGVRIGRVCRAVGSVLRFAVRHGSAVGRGDGDAVGRAVIGSGVIRRRDTVLRSRYNRERSRIRGRQGVIAVGQRGRCGGVIFAHFCLRSGDSHSAGIAVNQARRRGGGEFRRAVIGEAGFAPCQTLGLLVNCHSGVGSAFGFTIRHGSAVGRCDSDTVSRAVIGSSVILR